MGLKSFIVKLLFGIIVVYITVDIFSSLLDNIYVLLLFFILPTILSFTVIVLGTHIFNIIKSPKVNPVKVVYNLDDELIKSFSLIYPLLVDIDEILKSRQTIDLNLLIDLYGIESGVKIYKFLEENNLIFN
ncbi:MAG: hypothetical protein ACTSYR_00380 [Candidatus Odinarchaeia archaeon]